MVRVSFFAATMGVAAFLAFSAEETRAAPHLLMPHNIKKNFDKIHFPKQGVWSVDGFNVLGPENSHRYHAPSFSHSDPYQFIFSGPLESVLHFSDPELFYEGISDNQKPYYDFSTTEVKGETYSEPHESVLEAYANEFLDKRPSTSGVPKPSQEIRVPSISEQQGHIVEIAAPAFMEESHSTYEFPIYHLSTSEVSEQAIPEPHVPGLGSSTSEVLNNGYSDPEIDDHVFLLSKPRKSAGSLPVRDNSEQTNLPSSLPIVSTSGVTFLIPQTESNMSSQIQVSSPVVNGTSDQDVSFQVTETAHSTPTIFGASPANDPSSPLRGDYIELSYHPNTDYARQLQTALSSIGPLPLEPHS